MFVVKLLHLGDSFGYSKQQLSNVRGSNYRKQIKAMITSLKDSLTFRQLQ